MRTTLIMATCLTSTAAAQCVEPDIQRLTATNPRTSQAFGYDVAISGEWMAIGSPSDDRYAENSGSVAMFRRSPNGWYQFQKLFPPDPAAMQYFGQVVALEESTLAASAPSDDEGGTNAGATYVFTFTDGLWRFRQKLIPSASLNAQEMGGVDGLDLEGGRLAAGVYTPTGGTVLLYTRGSDGLWSFNTLVEPPSSFNTVDFGLSVALSGDRMLVGDPSFDDPSGIESSGIAFAYEQVGGVWTPTATFTSTSPTEHGAFGLTLELRDNDAAIGSPATTILGETGYGTVDLYRRRTDGTWLHKLVLAPPENEPATWFGYDIALGRNELLVGSADGFYRSAYYYQRTDNVWSYRGRMTAPPGSNEILYASAVAFDGSTAVVGSPGDSADVRYGGAAFVSDLTTLPSHTVADFNCDGALNMDDITAFAQLYQADDPRADVNFDGLIDPQDLDGLYLLFLWRHLYGQ